MSFHVSLGKCNKVIHPELYRVWALSLGFRVQEEGKRMGTIALGFRVVGTIPIVDGESIQEPNYWHYHVYLLL